MVVILIVSGTNMIGVLFIFNFMCCEFCFMSGCHMSDRIRIRDMCTSAGIIKTFT